MRHQSSLIRSVVCGLALMTAAALPLASAKAADPTPASTFTPAQRQELQRMIHDYIMANPEIISDAAALLQAKEAAASAERQKATIASRQQELIDPAEGTVIGNPKGDVTITEFFDYNCGYCKSLFPSMMDTLKEDGKVRLVLKEFPILAPSSIVASKAALAAVKQHKYAELHMALLGHKGTLSDDVIMSLAKEQGLDIARLQADMKSPEIAKIIARNEDLATVLQVNGTPALLIGKTFVPGAVSKDKLKELIAAARAKS